MRLSTAQLNSVMMTSMQTSTSGVNKAFMQLSSGEKMLKPSDDPLGSVQVMMLEREQATLEQFQRNISSLNGEISLQESYINSSHNAMLRIEELVTGVLSASGSTQDGREAVAAELDDLLEQLVDTMNSKSPNGDYLFSGTMTDTKPVVVDPTTGRYQFVGNDLQREVRISESVSVPANQTAQSLYFDGDKDIFNTLDQLITDLRDPSVSGDSLVSAVTGAQVVIDEAQQSVNGVWTALGASLNTLERTSGSHDDTKLLNDNLIGDVKDLDYSEAVLELNTQMAALQATQSTYSKVQSLSLFNLM